MRTSGSLFFVAFFCILITTSSCEKENYQPVQLTGYTESTSAYGEQNAAELNTGITVDNQSERTLAIKSYYCINGGKTLLPYDPNFHNIFVYVTSDEYQVSWTVDGIFYSEAPKLECICGGNFEVTVTRGEEMIGRAKYSAYCEVSHQN